MKIRLLAVDLDDTLLDDNLAISPRAKEAIKKARAAGVVVTIATGRMYSSTLRYAQELEIDVPLITYQGALVKTSVTGEVLYSRTVPVDFAREVITEAEAAGIPIQVYFDDKLYVAKLTPEIQHYRTMSGVPVHEVGDLIKFIDKEPTKVLLINDPVRLDEFAKKMQEKFGTKLYITKSKPYFLEFLHPEATKGKGLMAVADYLGIHREETMAVGDSYNDLELLRHAGWAVAMGNASDDIKKEADYVTLCNNEDGVAEAIEKFILNI